MEGDAERRAKQNAESILAQLRMRSKEYVDAFVSVLAPGVSDAKLDRTLARGMRRLLVTSMQLSRLVGFLICLQIGHIVFEAILLFILWVTR